MDSNFLKQSQDFINQMPYRQPPYDGRNWGHSWHSLCSYHGKLKPAIAHFLISEFTTEGQTVLDPLCGVGTIPFEACLQGRIGIGNDLSEMAYVVTKAKLEKPGFGEVKAVLEELQNDVEDHKNDFTGNEYSDFGFNGKIPSYFHRDTYKEILAARRFFLEKLPNISSAEAMAYSAFLHVLHGNRPYALSRRSHPLTPYAPTGEFEYKNVVDRITDKVRINYSAKTDLSFSPGAACHGDYSQLSASNVKADWIITSPPFANSFRFYIQNWMRLWLCGWEPDDYKAADERFLDKKQQNDFDVYDSFFEMCNAVLKPDGKIILHLGKTAKYDMGEELQSRAAKWFHVVFLSGEDVTGIEKHGIKDKGATLEHEYLFLQKK
jgi:hypothetical protein